MVKISLYYTLVLFLLFSACTKEGIYYIDSVSGNDQNTGHSQKQAWKSLKKVNETIFKPGDKILFKAGCSWQGQLTPKGSGASMSPIVINKYGQGTNPAIHGQGKELYTMLLYNIEHWEIRNLEITNTGNEREPHRRGVQIIAENFGDCHHIVLDSLEIHHVNGSLVKSEGAGSAILWHNRGDSIKTRFIDLQITNCFLHHCERNGINSRGYTKRSQWHPSLNVVIRNNLLENIPGDGIVPIGTDGAIVEQNIMRECPDILSHKEAAAGIWPWSADNTLIQYNEVSGHKAKWDGQGFDADWNCQNTIIQYNYSHDNYGGFLLVCNNGKNIKTDRNIGTTNTIVRYNISVNDGIRPYETERKSWFSPLMHITGPVENTKIYNNIFFIPKKKGPDISNTIVDMDNWGGPWPNNTLFANNVFHTLDTSIFALDKDLNTLFTNNLYYGNFIHLPDDPHALFENPLFVNPQTGINGLSGLEGFKLQNSSKAMRAGKIMVTEEITDFFGNKVIPTTKPSIGIYEFEKKTKIEPKVRSLPNVILLN